MLKALRGYAVIASLVAAPLQAQEPSCGNGKWTLLRQDEHTQRFGVEVATRIATARWSDWQRGVLLGDNIVLRLRHTERGLELHSERNRKASDPVLLQRTESLECGYVFDTPKIRLIARSR